MCLHGRHLYKEARQDSVSYNSVNVECCIMYCAAVQGALTGALQVVPVCVDSLRPLQRGQHQVDQALGRHVCAIKDDQQASWLLSSWDFAEHHWTILKTHKHTLPMPAMKVQCGQPQSAQCPCMILSVTDKMTLQ